MGVDITTYRIRIGCCRHICGTDVVRETVTVNVAMASTTACATLFLLLLFLGLLLTIQFYLDSEHDIRLSDTKVAAGVLYSMSFIRRGNIAVTERLIGAVVFIHLLLLAAGVEPNPGPELEALQSISKKDSNCLSLTMYLTTYVTVEFTISVYNSFNFRNISDEDNNKDKGYGQSSLSNMGDVYNTKDTFSSVYGVDGGVTDTLTKLSRTCSYLLGNKGAHMTHGNPHSKGDVTIDPIRALLEKEVHCSVGFIHLDRLNEERGEWSEDGFNSHGTGFRVGDCYMMTAYHVLRDRIESFIENITFEVTISKKLKMEDLLNVLNIKHCESLKDPRDVIKTYLKQHAVDIQLLLSRLGDNVSKEFVSCENSIWKKHCVVDFIDIRNKTTRFEVDWRIPFGCEESDILILKLMKTADDQTMPPQLYLAETYDQVDKMFIMRYINKTQPKIVVDKECTVFTDDRELEADVKSAVEWWRSIFPEEMENISYEGCTPAHNTDTGRVILKAARSFVYGASGSPIIYRNENEYDGVVFVGMIYQRGFPIFYYKTECFWDDQITEKTGKSIKNDVLFEGCTTMQKVAEILTKYDKLDLKNNIFDVKKAKRHSAKFQVATDVRKSENYDCIFDKLMEKPELQQYTLADILDLAKGDDHPTESMSRIVKQWTKDEEFFIETRATRYVYYRLTSCNIMTIVGCAGSGKSFAMHHAALKLQSQGFSLFVIARCSEVKKHINKNQQKQLFIIDDPFGGDEIDKEKLREWRTSNADIKAYMTGSTKLIMTIRTEISNSGRMIPDMCNQENINLHSKDLSMGPGDRYMYFNMALNKRNMQEKNTSTLYEMIKTCELQNFPLLVHIYCTDEYFRQHPSQLFTELIGAFGNRLESMWDHNKEQFGGLVLCSVNQDKLKVETFDQFIDQETPQMKTCKKLLNDLDISSPLQIIGEELNKLVGIYITKTSEYYTFKHSEFRNVITYIVGKRYSEFIIKYFDARFCLQRCKLARQLQTYNVYLVLQHGKRINTIDDKYKITIRQNSERRLAAAFIKCMADDNYLLSDTFASEFCQDENFLNTMYTEIKKADVENDYKTKVLYNILCNACLNNCIPLIDELMHVNRKYKGQCYGDITPLAACSYAGNTFHLKSILDLDDHADVINVEYEGVTPLGLAVYNKQASTINCLLQHNCDVNLGYFTPLTISVRIGDEETVELLLAHGADINKLDSNGVSPLSYAAHSEELTKLLLRRFADVNKCGEVEGALTPLSAACIRGQKNIVKILLENNAEVDTLDGSGNTALTNSINRGYKSIAHFLIRSNADINKKGKGEKGTTPLCSASETGCRDTVELLLQNHAEINSYDTGGLTPLALAIVSGHVHVANLLIDSNADVNMIGEGSNAFTPLSAAGAIGSVQIAKRLIDKGADINKLDGMLATPLTTAVIYNHETVAYFLIENKADVNICGAKGMTPMTVACFIESIDIIKCLLNAGADINKYDGHGITPLVGAIYHSNRETVDLLLKNNADINICGDKAFTPLTAASYKGCLAIVELLLHKGANINKYDGNGKTALTNATIGDNVDVLNLLLDRKSDVDICGAGCEALTPICAASYKGYVYIAQRLLQKGADINKYDGMGYTPLAHAIVHKKTDMVKFLLKKKADVNMSGYCNKDLRPLSLAIKRGSVDIVNLLVNKGAYLNKYDGDGMTPLSRAVGKRSTDLLYIISGCEITRRDLSTSLTLLEDYLITGFEDIVKILLNKGADINEHDGNGFTPLVTSILLCSVDFIDCMLENPADITTCSKGSTPLTTPSTSILTGNEASDRHPRNIAQKIDKYDQVHKTLIKRVCDIFKISAVNFLLENKADVNKCGRIGYTPLTAASFTGSIDTLTHLLHKGANINTCDGRGRSAITWAIDRKHTDIFNFLMEKNADVNICGKGDQALTPLTAASYTGQLDIVKRLLQGGAVMNKPDGYGRTAMTWAIEKGQIETFKFLLESKADVNVCNDGDDALTPLTAASVSGSVNIMKHLLHKGAGIDKYDGMGRTAITHAILMNKNDIINFLLESKADVNICGDGNQAFTPLTAASCKGSLDVVKRLLLQGADINKCDGMGRTATTRAIQNKHVEILNFLLKSNADVNISGDGVNASAPLIAASCLGYIDIVKTLLEKGALINKYDGSGNTAITRAIRHKHIDVFNLLMDKNADVNAFGEGGMTPLNAALVSGDYDVFELLVNKGADMQNIILPGVLL